MRSRLIVFAALVLAWSSLAIGGAPSVEAQEQTSSRGGIWGPDGFASGDNEGGRPSVQAGFNTTTGGVGPPARRSSGTPITCEYFLAGAIGGTGGDGSQTADPTQASVDHLRDLYDDSVANGNADVRVFQVCMQGGTVVSRRWVNWAPNEGGTLMTPEELMEIARSWLEFPPPSGATAPPMDPGTVAQLPTYFWVDNWAAVSESASAGPVTATVTATPVRQTWDIRDDVRDTNYTVACEGPGVAFDPASGGPPPEGACQWTPPHSSAGQSVRSEVSGEPCFEATVTITWAVGWDSNVGDGGSLGEGTSSSSACLVVAEVQAVVTGAP
jgi:hypothetical protein